MVSALSCCAEWVSRMWTRTADRPGPARTLCFEALEPRLLLSAKPLGDLASGLPHAIAAALPPDDKYENNDTFAKATSLGTRTKPFELADLVLNDEDWFKFTIKQRGDLNDFVSIGFDHSQGDIDLELYNIYGTKLAESRGTADREFITLNDRQQGVYFIRVYGWRGSTNPSYDLSISPANNVDQQHTVFVNFDGIQITHDELVRYENGEWLSGRLALWDAGNDGITVSDYLAGRPDREVVIAAVLKNLRNDLKPFGIQVVRHFGSAWENVGATTLFLGASTLDGGGPNSASAVDTGNDNRTDIAFIGDQTNLWSASKDLILGTSDAALHEAGHTFGLAHVISGDTNETMGRRLAFVNRASWLVDTAFLNKSFALHNVPPGSYQNSYAVMKATFVTGVGSSNLLASPAAFSADDLDCSADLHDHGALTSHVALQPAVVEQPLSDGAAPTRGWAALDRVAIGSWPSPHAFIDSLPGLWEGGAGSARRARGF